MIFKSCTIPIANSEGEIYCLSENGEHAPPFPAYLSLRPE